MFLLSDDLLVDIDSLKMVWWDGTSSNVDVDSKGKKIVLYFKDGTEQAWYFNSYDDGKNHWEKLKEVCNAHEAKRFKDNNLLT